jgi:hypothetical protein
MEKLTRRKFFKSSTLTLLALPIFGKAMGLFNKAYAFARNDSAIDKQGYVHDGTGEVKDPAHAKHVTKIKDYLKEIKKESDSMKPLCHNCMQFKKVESDGYGECAMVMATGKADGKFVYKDGWCKVWTIAKDKVKKEAGA